MGYPLGNCHVSENCHAYGNCHGFRYNIGYHVNFSKARPSEPRFFIYRECAALNSRAHKGGIKMNTLYRNAILVTLEPDDPFIRLTTIDRQHGKSSSFLLDADKITQLLTFKTDSLLDSDLLSFARMYLLNPDLAILRVTWIRDTSADNTVTGYRQTLVLPTKKLLAVLDGQIVRVVSNEFPLESCFSYVNRTSYPSASIIARNVLLTICSRLFTMRLTYAGEVPTSSATHAWVFPSSMHFVFTSSSMLFFSTNITSSKQVKEWLN